MDTPVASSAPTSTPQTRGQWRPSGKPTAEPDQFSRALLSAMLSFKQGDFAVRMPADLVGVNGKIADAFNDIAARQRAARARNGAGLARASARKASSNSA